MTSAEIACVLELAENYRARLYDLSWFMRTLNEYIARKPNAEDEVKGRFWEGRFKNQALLDEKALLAAMAYVDLNPVRARLAETPEASDYISSQERLGRGPASGRSRLPLRITWNSWIGQAAPYRPRSRGHIAATQPKILDRLGIDGTRFLVYADRLLKEFGTAVGTPQALVDLCTRRQAKYLRGIRTARRLFLAQDAA